MIGFDDEVDLRYVAIEAGVQSLLSPPDRPSPSTSGFVLAILRVNLHLERIADYCVTRSRS